MRRFSEAAQSRADWEYTSECLDEVCFLGGGDNYDYDDVSSDPPTPEWMKSCPENESWSSDDEDEARRTRGQVVVPLLPVQNETTTTATTTTATTTKINPCFDPNNPLGYFLETGEISLSEYNNWKLVLKRPEDIPKSWSRPDYGPGYNDTDSEGEDIVDASGCLVFGAGYTTHHWNTYYTQKYEKIAGEPVFMLSRLAQVAREDEEGTTYRLTDSFELKLLWERYENARTVLSLQDFWQQSALQIYESLQDLRANHAKILKNHSICIPASIPAPPDYHTTPIETLEATFETIGRMSRCIADDFNTCHVVDYVKEFIVALYQEIEFNALVDEDEHRIWNAECNRQMEEQRRKRQEEEHQRRMSFYGKSFYDAHFNKDQAQ